MIFSCFDNTGSRSFLDGFFLFRMGVLGGKIRVKIFAVPILLSCESWFRHFFYEVSAEGDHAESAKKCTKTIEGKFE